MLIAGGFANLVEGNFIAGNQDSGVQIEAGQNHRVEANELGTAALPNDEGVLVQDSFNVVTGNTATGNRDAGIKIEGGAAGPPPVNNVIEDNDSSGNEQGVVIEDAHLNAVTGNTVTGNLDEGVLIEAFNRPSADGNWLTGNTIEDNGLSGVRIEDGADNLRRHPGSRRQRHHRQRRGRRDRRPGRAQLDRQQLDLRQRRPRHRPRRRRACPPTTACSTPTREPTASRTTRPSTATCLFFTGTFPDLVTKNLIGWTLRTAASTDYRLEFYVNDTCGGRGEAKELIATRQVTTDATGLAQGSITVDPVDDEGDGDRDGDRSQRPRARPDLGAQRLRLI